MELTAVIRALEALKRPVRGRVYTDSQYVRQGVLEWLPQWKARGWKTADKKPVKNQDLWQALDALAAAPRSRMALGQGHSGNVGNERVDVLANRAIDAILPPMIQAKLRAMRQIVLDVETTGLEASCRPSHHRDRLRRDPQSPAHRAEIPSLPESGARDRRGRAGRARHRAVAAAQAPKFAEIGAELSPSSTAPNSIIHNAPFDVGFLDAELARLPGDARGVARCAACSTRWRWRAACTRASATVSMRCASATASTTPSASCTARLLDAGILVDVYLAMTGGQSALALDTGARRVRRTHRRPRERVTRARDPAADAGGQRR